MTELRKLYFDEFFDDDDIEELVELGGGLGTDCVLLHDSNPENEKPIFLNVTRAESLKVRLNQLAFHWSVRVAEKHRNPDYPETLAKKFKSIEDKATALLDAIGVVDEHSPHFITIENMQTQLKFGLASSYHTLDESLNDAPGPGGIMRLAYDIKKTR